MQPEREKIGRSLLHRGGAMSCPLMRAHSQGSNLAASLRLPACCGVMASQALPLMFGLIAALSMKQFAGLRWNAVALGLSCVYLAWSVAAQAHVARIVRSQVGADALFFVTPTPLNTIAWRIVVMRDNVYSEGFYSFFDKDRNVRFDQFPNQSALMRELEGNWAAQRMAWFTHGFYALREVNGQVILADLRMGQEPDYVFQFAIAQRDGSALKAITPQQAGSRSDAAKLLPWLWARIKGQDIAPPR